MSGRPPQSDQLVYPTHSVTAYVSHVKLDMAAGRVPVI